MRVWKTKTWDDNWNDILRTVIFQDEELKELMLIPARDKSDIMKFVSEYFVEDPMPDELVTDQKVRVIYYESDGVGMNVPGMSIRFLEFDIFVHDSVLRTATRDRLKGRDKQIYERLKYLLTGSTYVCNMRYECEDDFSLGSKMVGYKRYHAVFSYKKSY